MTDSSPPSGRIVIAGGSGFLGVSLATHLAAGGAAVVLLSRRPPKPSGPWRHVSWDGRSLGDWRQELDGVAQRRLGAYLAQHFQRILVNLRKGEARMCE